MDKGLDERSDEGMLQWFGYVEKIAKTVCRRVCCSCSVGRLRKRWIDTVKKCLKEKRFGCQASKKMVQDRSEWKGFVRGYAWGIAQGMNP